MIGEGAVIETYIRLPAMENQVSVSNAIPSSLAN